MNRGQKFAVFDIDGTIIRWQLFHAIVDALARNNDLPPATYEQVQAARAKWKTRIHEESFREYERRLVTIFTAALKGMPIEAHKRACQQVFNEYKDQVYRYTRELIKSLKAQGYTLFAISGSPDEVVEPFATYYGFDDFIGTTYHSAGGAYTGEATLFIGRKDLALAALAQKHGLGYQGSIAVGDSEGDIAMLEAVEHPIAFNPSKKLFTQATRQGWHIIVERKNVVYELNEQDGVYVLEG